jgi:hypothetical protein
VFGYLAERVRASGEHLVLNRYGKPVVVLVRVGWHEEMQPKADT